INSFFHSKDLFSKVKEMAKNRGGVLDTIAKLVGCSKGAVNNALGALGLRVSRQGELVEGRVLTSASVTSDGKTETQGKSSEELEPVEQAGPSEQQEGDTPPASGGSDQTSDDAEVGDDEPTPAEPTAAGVPALGLVSADECPDQPPAMRTLTT